MTKMTLKYTHVSEELFDKKIKIHDELLQFKIGLDYLNTGIIIADNERKIVHVNSAVVKLFKNMEHDIHKTLPEFNATNLIGKNIDLFHKNSLYQSELLKNLTETINSYISFGNSILYISVSPIIDKLGERLGYIAEWCDVTEYRKSTAELVMKNQKLAFENEQEKEHADELASTNVELMTEMMIGYNDKTEYINELARINKMLVFEQFAKEKRAAELLITNQKLVFQNEEKEKRAAELLIANEELAFQNSEKEKRANELTLSYEQNMLLNSQINHMQKLESIGRLTSGIAHDFNNILMCILGFNELNKMDSEDITDKLLRESFENNAKQIDLAGNRAADLINKMLTYCRQDTQKQKIDIRSTTTVIDESLEMLRPALTSRIKLETIFECDEIIQISAIDLQQILTNLIINARDAVKECGGIITISLKLETLLEKAHCAACATDIKGNFITHIERVSSIRNSI
jgi:signal transduction histidine kinase